MKTLAKVLVVDDDVVVGQSYGRVLTQNGYTVSTALNGLEALEKFAGEKPDVVLTDIRMPGMDGIEMAQRIKAQSPATPVAVVTGYGTSANAEAAAAIGITEFLHKPLQPEKVVDLVARIAQKQAAEEETAAKVEALEESKPRTVGRTLKDIAMFFAAPFIGLVYFIGFPIVGLGMLIWYGYQALTSRPALDE